MAEALPAHLDARWMSEAEANLPEGSLRRVAMLTLLTIVLGLGGFVGWAAVTTVDSAVPAQGVVVASGKRKTITILDSGILRELLVHEGDKVAAGDVLVRLDDVQLRTTRSQANVLYWSAVARAARLEAEAADQRELPANNSLSAAASDPAVAAAVTAEANQFRARWSALDSNIQVSQRKIAQQQAQISTLRAQLTAVTTRLELTREQLRAVDYLVERGLAPKPRQLELRGTEADLVGQLGQLDGQWRSAMQAIAQVQSEILNVIESRRADISRDRSDAQAAKADAEQRLRAADDLLGKREILAPEAGVVTDLKYFTPGSTIMGGQPVMDLVPDGQRLLIEGSVAPGDVEHLAIGQRVNIRLSSYKAHRVPVVTGRLAYVAADRQVDANNNAFFLVRAELDDGVLRDKPGVVLSPGMPADVLIINGARSVLDFLISPITDSIHHSMREE